MSQPATYGSGALDRLEAALRAAGDGAPPAPATIGRYDVRERIGQGGMGEVYRAEQRAPVRRTVALKLIKLGMDSREVVRRFEAERQALAWMDHPNVARVLDAGTDPLTGRPFFVMEYVPGEPITRFCDERRLTVRQRLALFTGVCGAVAHAHQKMVVHRDLKPSNILVTQTDGQPPQVKVIDFGVAKAVGAPLTEETLTEAGQPVGTPEYMSPEQASGGRDVDTRSDIYSLGVVLYELLAGAPPFDPRALRASGPAALERTLRETDPPRPSTRLSSLAAEDAQAIARRRQTHVRELSRTLRGELEWIPLKAMRKQRDRRYATAAQLADDIANYLAHQPLLAAPESRGYRLRKFLRRRRIEVVAGALVLASLVAGIAGTTTFAVRASRQRALAQLRADQTNAVAEFQAQMLSGIDVQLMGARLRDALLAEAEEGWRRAGTSSEEAERQRAQLEALMAAANFTNTAIRSLDENVLRRALVMIERRFVDQPLVKARLLQHVAMTMRQLTLLNGAVAPQAEALAIRRRELGNDHPDTLDSLYEMSHLLGLQGKFGEGIPYARESLSGYQRVGGHDRLMLRSMLYLGDLLARDGRLDEAERYKRDTLEGCQRLLPRDDRQTLFSLFQVGQILTWQRKLAEAEPYAQGAVREMRRVLGPDDPNTLHALTTLGTLRVLQGDLAAAEADLREAWRGLRAAHGDDSRHTFFVALRLAQVLRLQGRLEESERYLQRALEAMSRTLHADHVDRLMADEELAWLRRAQGRSDEAEERFLDLYRRAGRADIPPIEAARFRSAYGVFLAERARYADAEPPLRDAYERLVQTQQQRHERTRAVVSALAEVTEHTGRGEEAARWRAELARLRATTQPAAPVSGSGG